MSNITDQQLRGYIDHVFMRYDQDRSGTLSSNELEYFFNDLFQMMNNPRRVSLWEAQQALKEIDINNDGQASKEELYLAFKKILNPGSQQNYGGYGGQQQQNSGWGNQPPQQQSGWGNQSGNQGWGQNQGNQGYGQNPNQNQGWGNQPQNQGWGNQPQNQGWGNQPQSQSGWGQNTPQQNQSGWGNQQQSYKKNWGSSSGW